MNQIYHIQSLNGDLIEYFFDPDLADSWVPENLDKINNLGPVLVDIIDKNLYNSKHKG
jgi:hypothetical protein